MKKIAAIAVVGCIAMVVMTAGTASADVQKVPLVPWAGYPGPGTGFVIFSNSTNPANNLHITVSLKGADLVDLGTNVLDVWLRHDDDDNPYDTPYEIIGSLTLNKAGNGNFHINTSVPTNQTNWFWLGLLRPGEDASVWVCEWDPDYPSLDFK